MDPNTAMETIGAGAKAATKLGEIVEKVFGPRWTRKQADADAYSDQRKLQTIRENPDMEIVYVNGQINARERSPEALAYRARQRLLTDAIREESNIENVLEAASKELQQVESVSDEPVDDDWITRFFSKAKDVSNEEMHFIWGRILAGEVQKPGSFSLRTLDIISNLTQKEAEAFQSYLPYIMVDSDVNAYITSEKAVTEKYKIDGSNLFKLDACGLLQVIPFSEFNVRISPNEAVRRFYTRNQLLVIENKTSGVIETRINNIYLLTEAGKELFNLLAPEPNDPYFTDWVEQIYSQGPKGNLKYTIHSKIPDKEKEYFAEPTVIFE